MDDQQTETERFSDDNNLERDKRADGKNFAESRDHCRKKDVYDYERGLKLPCTSHMSIYYS